MLNDRDLNVEEPLDTIAAILNWVERESGSKAKADILSAYKSKGEVLPFLLDFFRCSLDPFAVYHIQLPPYEVDGVGSGTKVGKGWWVEWMDTLECLRTGSLSGNSAREKVEHLLGQLSPRERKWATRMLNKDPRLGMAEKSILKVFPNLFSTFSCQLCDKWDGEFVPSAAIIEPKLDGLRALAFVYEDGTSVILSRNGKALNNVGHIASALSDSFRGCVVDGELFASDWRSSVSAARKTECGDTTSKLMAFDCIPLQEFVRSVSQHDLSTRRLELLNRFNDSVASISGCVDVVKAAGVSTLDDIERVTSDYIVQGYEGSVLKDLSSKYEYKRSSSWSKVKRFNSADLKVIGMVEGRGKYVGTLGALQVEGDGVTASEVGTGLTDEQRRFLWNNKDALIGRTIEVSYQELTPDKKLRFPVFKRIREDV